ncbi:MAG: hypothetical protein PIR53_02670 [Nocardioides alkalitolerans]
MKNATPNNVADTPATAPLAAAPAGNWPDGAVVDLERVTVNLTSDLVELALEMDTAVERDIAATVGERPILAATLLSPREARRLADTLTRYANHQDRQYPDLAEHESEINDAPNERLLWSAVQNRNLTPRAAGEQLGLTKLEVNTHCLAWAARGIYKYDDALDLGTLVS